MKKALLILSVLSVIAMAVLNMTYQDGPEPDVVYPIAKRKPYFESMAKYKKQRKVYRHVL